VKTLFFARIPYLLFLLVAVMAFVYFEIMRSRG
jgi:hypothetical protein